MTYLKIADAGKIASGNVAKVTDKLHGFCQEGQSLNRRPPSKATMNRLIDFRTLNYISISTEILHLIVKNCNCGLEFSGDMSAIMKHELFVSAFTIFWSTLSDPDDRDIDGDRKASYFSGVYENPPIPVAGKDAITMAGVVKELFILRKFVPADTTVENFLLPSMRKFALFEMCRGIRAEKTSVAITACKGRKVLRLEGCSRCSS